MGIHGLHVQKGTTMLWCKPEASLCNEKYWSSGASFSKMFVPRWTCHLLQNQTLTVIPTLPYQMQSRLWQSNQWKVLVTKYTMARVAERYDMEQTTKRSFSWSNSLEIWCLWSCFSLQHWFQGCGKYYERATILVKSPWDTKCKPLTQLPVCSY